MSEANEQRTLFICISSTSTLRTGLARLHLSDTDRYPMGDLGRPFVGRMA